MASPTYRKNLTVLWFLTVVFLSCIINRNHLCSNHPFASSTISSDSGSSIPLSLKKLRLDGYLSSKNIDHQANDFGNIHHYLPSAVLHPKSVSDISSTIKHIFDLGPTSELTVAARGHAHSLQGQAQANQGVVIEMESLQQEMYFQKGELPFVDVSAGELWINVLHESLKHGLSPKAWTDYLYLTVGGTLSNAGISGQAFRHGPQINNVYQLEVVTGKGELITCSDKQNADLFNAVLGGLGQFGIITRARIPLERAPSMVAHTPINRTMIFSLQHVGYTPIQQVGYIPIQQVKWIRVLYSDFSTFTKDQEHLISSEDGFDYIEGFVIINRTGLLNNWRSFFSPKDPLQASQFKSDGKTLFCLEIAKYFNPYETDQVNQDINRLLSELSYIQSTLFLSEISYVDFLDRVHKSELKLREKGLWEVPHPWLNILVPRSRIHEFAKVVFGKILADSSSTGPILIYPANKSKWNNKTSMVTPDEDVFYLVAFLFSAMPSSRGTDGLAHILTQNKRILEFCETARLGVKQYLPHYMTHEEWRTHYGPQWETFARRKSTYDPLAILAPGQKIFQKGRALS